jgi:hypothetical protein
VRLTVASPSAMSCEALSLDNAGRTRAVLAEGFRNHTGWHLLDITLTPCSSVRHRQGGAGRSLMRQKKSNCPCYERRQNNHATLHVCQDAAVSAKDLFQFLSIPGPGKNHRCLVEAFHWK